VGSGLVRLARSGSYDEAGGVELSIRVATRADEPALREVMDAAIEELQRGFLTQEQIASSRAIMGIDTQLVADGTYYVVEDGGEVAGCGGWSRRATLYGSDHTPGRDPAHLDPAVDPARVRAMYTHPAHARRGVGRMVLAACEAAARAEGFTRLELMSTLSGRPLYAAYGFEAVEEVVDDRGGAPVPLVRMTKRVSV
jgi:GNAT superfamily N-acetyltransferase